MDAMGMQARFVARIFIHLGSKDNYHLASLRMRDEELNAEVEFYGITRSVPLLRAASFK